MKFNLKIYLLFTTAFLVSAMAVYYIYERDFGMAILYLISGINISWIYYKFIKMDGEEKHGRQS